MSVVHGNPGQDHIYHTFGEPMLTEAVCNFWAGKDREQDAALAWAFELTYFFRRGVGEAPMVTAIPSWHVHRGTETYDSACGLRLNFWNDHGICASRAGLWIYTARGLMSTTHPGDSQPVTTFDQGSAWCLDYAMDSRRQAVLLGSYLSRTYRWDGRS